MFSANFRSGFVYETNGSINMGMVGLIANNFRFRWLAHDTGVINYASDVDQIMYLDGRGCLNVKNGIGIGSPISISSPYKLLVDGTIGARRLKITQLNPWPDYVFHLNYSLPTLSSLEKFITENKHLPEMPSEEEVKVDGVDVGEMNSLLLKKVEELTLYIIQLNKRIDAQQEVISTIQH